MRFSPPLSRIPGTSTSILLLVLLPALMASGQNGEVLVHDESLHLMFRVPSSWPPLKKQAGFSALRTYSGQRGREFRIEVAVIPRENPQADRDDVWPHLERLVTKTLKTSGARLLEARACWRDQLPAFRFRARLRGTKKGPDIIIEGQYILSPVDIVFAQCISLDLPDRNTGEINNFLAGMKRPGLNRPGEYVLKSGGVTLRYPPGLLPHFRNGIIELEDPRGQLALMLLPEEGGPFDERDMICDLAASLSSLREGGTAPWELLEGPGLLQETPEGGRVLGYSARRPVLPDALSQKQKTVHVRFYVQKARRLFVSGFTLCDGKQSPGLKARMKGILESVHWEKIAQ